MGIPPANSAGVHLPSKPASRVKKAGIAFLLSLLFPGLGQIYNRQLRKGLWMAIVSTLLGVAAEEGHALGSFRGMVAYFLILGGWTLIVAVEAARGAWTRGDTEAAYQESKPVLWIFALVVILVSFLPASLKLLRRNPSFRAFRVPSASMCPTICMNERIVADMNAYAKKAPERGDIILVEHAPIKQLFIKRVIGVGGDLIEPGPQGKIFVNGSALKEPKICGQPIRDESPEVINFCPTRVAEGSFFVVGDNLGNSYDSRISSFGFVNPDEVRGKPVFIYWSRARSRIGCKVQ